MKISSVHIGWLAGIVEGEGCILVDRRNLAIKVSMTDRDVMERVASILHSAHGPLCHPERPYLCRGLCRACYKLERRDTQRDAA